MKLSVAATMQVTFLGRAYFAGNTGTHVVKLINAGTGVDLPGAYVQITMDPHRPAPFQYVALPEPVTLQPGVKYLLVSSETTGGDVWQDVRNLTQVGGNAGFAIDGAVYSDPNGAYVFAENTSGSGFLSPSLLYGPTDLQRINDLLGRYSHIISAVEVMTTFLAILTSLMLAGIIRRDRLDRRQDAHAQGLRVAKMNRDNPAFKAEGYHLLE